MIPSVEIIRLQEDFEFGTFGALKINKMLFCWTLERTDMENEQNVSCIPAQQYECKRYHSSRFADTFQIMDVPGRNHILFHPANTMDQLQGCISLGERLDYISGPRAILNSGNTFKRFMTEMKGHNGFHLTIKEEY